MPIQRASHGQTFLSCRPIPFKANLGKLISLRLQKPDPVPAKKPSHSCMSDRPYLQTPLSEQETTPLKLCLSPRLSLHLLNNNGVCFLRENLEQQRRLAVAGDPPSIIDTTVITDSESRLCHTKTLFVPTALEQNVRNYITNMGLVFFKLVAFVPGLEG